MNFSTNYDDLGSGGLLPEGKYECIVKDAFPSETKNGFSYLDIRMVIRNDVEQSYKNKYIFHSIWKKKEPTEQDKQVDGYSFKQLMSLASAAGLPAGKNYASVEELCKDFVGKCVNVEIEHDMYNKDNPRERVKFCNKTAYPECKHVFKEAAAPVNSGTYQKPKQDAFAQPASVGTQTVDLDGFEEIIGEDSLPF